MTPEQTIGTVLATVDRVRRAGLQTRRITGQLAGSLAVKALHDEGYAVTQWRSYDAGSLLVKVAERAREAIESVTHAQGGYWIEEDAWLRLRRALDELDGE